jgi:hypothetical protein
MAPARFATGGLIARHNPKDIIFNASDAAHTKLLDDRKVRFSDLTNRASDRSLLNSTRFRMSFQTGSLMLHRLQQQSQAKRTTQFSTSFRLSTYRSISSIREVSTHASVMPSLQPTSTRRRSCVFPVFSATHYAHSFRRDCSSTTSLECI